MVCGSLKFASVSILMCFCFKKCYKLKKYCHYYISFYTIWWSIRCEFWESKKHKKVQNVVKIVHSGPQKSWVLKMFLLINRPKLAASCQKTHICPIESPALILWRKNKNSRIYSKSPPTFLIKKWGIFIKCRFPQIWFNI